MHGSGWSVVRSSYFSVPMKVVVPWPWNKRHMGVEEGEGCKMGLRVGIREWGGGSGWVGRFWEGDEGQDIVNVSV